MLPIVLELFAYTRWANHRILEAVAPLQPEELDRQLGGSFGSLRATLVHTLGADWIWLRRWRGQAASPLPEWDTSSTDAIRSLWEGIMDERDAFLSDLDADSLERPLHYTNLSGAPFTAPLGELLLHVVNHATYHRGQAVHLLRQLGHRAPATDLVVFQRDRGVRGS